MIRRPPRSTRTDTLFPYTTLFRSGIIDRNELQCRPAARLQHAGDGAKEIRPIFLAHRLDHLDAGDGIESPRDVAVIGEAEGHLAGQSGAFDPVAGKRSEERRVGQEWVSTCRSRGSPIPKKKKKNINK